MQTSTPRIVKPPGRLLPLVILLATLAACRVQPAAPVAARARDSWRTLSWEDRHDVMTFAVLPNMARTFQRFRGSADPDMTCATCHGADAELVAYAMPHGLPALDPAHLPDPDAQDAKQARMAKFMIEEVTPAMADLLGVPAPAPAERGRDPKRGLSCFTCHPSR